MIHRRPTRLARLGTLTMVGVLLAAVGCDSRRAAQPAPPSARDAIIGVPGEVALIPGPGGAPGSAENPYSGDSGAVALIPGSDVAPGSVDNPYSGDSGAIADGRRLYIWYNCGACHGELGGGGMGPPLRDQQWIYGGDAVSIYRSIMQGRPQGMPGWIGKIPDDQVWQIVAFIEALAGDEFDFDPALRPPRNRVHPSAFGDGQLSPTEP